MSFFIQRTCKWIRLSTAVGAIFFLISDMIIGFDRFFSPIQDAQVIGKVCFQFEYYSNFYISRCISWPHIIQLRLELLLVQLNRGQLETKRGSDLFVNVKFIGEPDQWLKFLLHDTIFFMSGVFFIITVNFYSTFFKNKNQQTNLDIRLLKSILIAKSANKIYALGRGKERQDNIVFRQIIITFGGPLQ